MGSTGIDWDRLGSVESASLRSNSGPLADDEMTPPQRVGAPQGAQPAPGVRMLIGLFGSPDHAPDVLLKRAPAAKPAHQPIPSAPAQIDQRLGRVTKHLLQ